MRINQFIAQATGLSRRASDKALSDGRVKVNGQPVILGTIISEADKVSLDNKPLSLPSATLTIMLNKPAGYVTSRSGQGSKTIYDLLPKEYSHLKPVGRLDKDSSGLLLLTNDGKLAHMLTHPSFAKEKVYDVKLNKPLSSDNKTKIEQGVMLEDGISKLQISEIGSSDLNSAFLVSMNEGRNRQIRRTFDALGYKVTNLHRSQFGEHSLNHLRSGKFKVIIIK